MVVETKIPVKTVGNPWNQGVTHTHTQHAVIGDAERAVKKDMASFPQKPPARLQVMPFLGIEVD